MADKVEYVLTLKDLFSDTIKKANSEADKFEGKVDSIQGSLNRLATAVGIAFSINAIKDFGMSVVETGARFEMAEMGLSTLLKSSQAGHAAFEQIKKDAASTPFGVESLLMADKALISTGLSAEKSREDVLNLANAIIATGGGDDELNRMSINLQQIRNIGKATALDIKQFGYAGINIYGLLADATGKSTEEVKNMEVSYDTLAFAFKKAAESGGLYENAMENASKTTQVKLSNIGDTVNQLKNDVFLALKPQIDNTIMSLMGFIQTLRDGVSWLSQNKTEVQTLGIVIGGLTVALNINNIAWGIQRVAMLASTVQAGLYNIAAFASLVATEGLTAALYAAGITGAAAWGMLTGGLTLIAAGFYYAWQRSEMFRGGLLGIWEVIKELGQPLLQLVKAIALPTPDNILGAIDAFKKVDLGAAFSRGYEKGKDKEEKKTLAQLSTDNKSAVPTLPTNLGTSKTTTGGSSVTKKNNVINVNIGKLVEGLTIKVENSEKGLEQMQEKITQYIVSAINDATVIAGGL